MMACGPVDPYALLEWRASGWNHHTVGMIAVISNGTIGRLLIIHTSSSVGAMFEGRASCLRHARCFESEWTCRISNLTNGRTDGMSEVVVIAVLTRMRVFLIPSTSLSMSVFPCDVSECRGWRANFSLPSSDSLWCCAVSIRIRMRVTDPKHISQSSRQTNARIRRRGEIRRREK